MQQKDLFERIIQVVDTNVMLCLFPCILTLMLTGFIFKSRFKPKEALNLICWFVVVYSFAMLTHFIFTMIFNPEKHSFISRATGSYAWAYWFMFTCAIILPYTLLIKKLASNYLYVLLVVLLIKSGFYFERFVIIVTTIHRDYLPESGSSSWMNMLIYGLTAVFLQGFILAILLLGIVELIDKYKVLYKSANEKHQG